jgi:transcription elongation factor Elf1
LSPDESDACPRCGAALLVSRELLTLDVTDLSILLDCGQCGVRLRLRGVIGEQEQALLSCGL